MISSICGKFIWYKMASSNVIINNLLQNVQLNAGLRNFQIVRYANFLIDMQLNAILMTTLALLIVAYTFYVTGWKVGVTTAVHIKGNI